ncbi:MAG: response regulator transcription factor [Betaproteobacteria bacterium]
MNSTVNNSRSPTLRVFVVEDSELIRKRIVENVRSIGGYEIVGFAESAQEAMRSIDSLRPDIVITDIRLKEGNGIEVVRHVRANPYAPRPRIFVLTNYAFPEYKHQCSIAGADEFFDKSSEYDRFLELMHDTQ